MAISSQILIESQKVADPYFYHPDLVIFMDMADYINGIGASKAVLGDDKFPVILYKNKTYDFRNVQQRKFYENLIMKSPKGTKMSKKKTKRK